LIIALLATAAMPLVAGGQAPRPLPDRTAFFTATQENLARSQREQSRYAYKERRTELHTNPFGRIGTDDDVRVYDVVPGPQPGVVFRTLIEKNGAKVLNEKPERQERRERPQARSSSINEVVETLEFVMQRRESVDGREAIVVTFTPRADARPKTREGKLAKIFSGTIWIDEAASEVIRVEATATESMSYGFGVIARLNDGTKVTLTRQPVDGTVWLPTSIRIVGAGRAMLFRKLTVDFSAEWFDYRRVRQ
jgi:hypothetical protein